MNPSSLKIRVLGISTSPRVRWAGESNSKKVLRGVLDKFRELGAETKLVDLSELRIFHCGGHYSLGPRECYYPCRRMEEEPSDEMLQVYEALFRFDVAIFGTPIRWGNHCALLQCLIERMNCVENMDSVFGVKMLKDKVAGIVVVGHEDGYQRVAGILMSTLCFMGFNVPANAICYFVGPSDESTDLDTDRMRQNDALDNSMEELVKGTYELAIALKK